MNSTLGERDKDIASPVEAYGLASALVEQQPKPSQPPPAPPRVDRAWARRLREDARRPLSENLAEGIALSHVLVRYPPVTPPRR